ncbi:MAG TPA: class I SAM-dependent methyltransferase [Gammaproteobacteria bacterium]|nr:class I SAM-dependent methyltransferase [Gammaproteobacteria bacterium]
MAGKRRYRYRPPRGPGKHLSAEFFSPRILAAGEQLPDDLPRDLYGVWKGIPNGHKWLHYFETYASVLAPFAKRPIRLLEIGVYNGSSVRMWREYLHPDSVIVGLDIDEACKQYDRPDENVHIRIGDQSTPGVRRLVDEFGPFDLILDDGSHMCSHMVASFNHLFLEGLKNPGVYVVEDTHSNFWKGFRDQKYSFVDLCKDLVDFMHCHYVDHPGEPFFRRGHKDALSSLSVPRICAEIDEIRFKDSLVIIHKKTRTSLPSSVHL